MMNATLIKFVHETIGTEAYRVQKNVNTTRYVPHMDFELKSIRYSTLQLFFIEWLNENNLKQQHLPSANTIIAIFHGMCTDIRLPGSKVLFDAKIITLNKDTSLYIMYDHKIIESHILHIKKSRILSESDINIIKSKESYSDKFKAYYQIDPHSAGIIISDVAKAIRKKKNKNIIKHLDVSKYTTDQLQLKRYEPISGQMKKLNLWKDLISSDTHHATPLKVLEVGKYANVDVVNIRVKLSDDRIIVLEALPAHYAEHNKMWMDMISEAQRVNEEEYKRYYEKKRKREEALQRTD